jgi:hypothetical protein
MKRFLAFLITLAALPALGQGNISIQATSGGGISLSNPNGNPFLLTQSNLQTAVGPLALPYLETFNPVPFQAASAAFFGYNQAGTGNVDLHAGNGGGFDLWTPNNLGTGWSNILHVDRLGTVNPANDVQLTSGNCYYLGGVQTEGVCDDQFGGVTISTTGSATNGINFQRLGVTQWQIDPGGNLDDASGTPVLLAGVTGTTGTGKVVYSASPALTGAPTAPTGGSCAGNTNIATQQYVANCAGGGSGVTTLALTTTGSSGASTGNITGATLTLNIPQYTSTNIALVTLAIPSGLVAAANSCYGYQSGAWGLRPSNGGTTTAATISLPGILVSPTPALVTSSFQGSADSTVGWGKVGGLTLNLWASAADTASWDVCNPTSAQVPPTGTAGTPSFTVGARN